MIVSEWTKLRSVRSTRWSLLAATVLTIGFPILASTVISSHWGSRSPADRAHFNPLDPALIGSQIAQLAIAVLGVLVITGEYSTGMIRASFTAVPEAFTGALGQGRRVRRRDVRADVAVGADRVLRQPVDPLAASRRTSHGHIPGSPGAVIGAALYLTVIAVLTLGIGAIIRNTAGGIAAFAAIFFVVPPLLNVLPTSWNDAITPYLPGNAGRAILSITHDAHSLAPWTGFGLLCAYTAATLAVAAMLLVRRDT